ncbi:DHH phosphoesterase superfamily [Sesbania bispinosa]|nr:DHH phosphoesterase superfamily [Sesbania bispinosa]
MERRLGRESKGSLSLQKKMAETRRREEPTPDLTDFMNDMFFGTINTERKTYDLTGGGRGASLAVDDDDDGFDDSTRSNSARLTQEWLQEARRIVASSPSRGDSPGRLVGSPRFAAAQPGSPLPSLDRREALSRTRSARRFRAVEGISDEILLKSAKHSRNKSDTFVQPSSEGDGSPATAVHKWFSNILKPTNSNNTPLTPPPPSPDSLPPRQPFPRKSRFQTEPSGTPHQQGIQAPTSRRTFKSTSAPSPENPNRRTPPPSDSQPLSPPKNLVESAHRRTISSSTCSREKIAPSRHVTKGEEETNHEHSLNGFLKEQRSLFQKISNGEIHPNATIVLSGPSNSTASMVAAICHAWLLGYRQRENGSEDVAVVVPVMNVKRGSMWKLRQAAWLFHHAGLDATALLFTDEVDMESLLVTGQLSVLVVGQDVLSTTGEVGSQCTILTDNYCEDAYDLLQNPVLKKLLLAGILLDTQNLKASASVSMTRDAEAVQLLLVGLAPNYRYALFDQLMQDQKSTSFVEALNHNYGKAPDQSDQNNEGNMEHKARGRKSSSTSDRETTMSSPKTNSIDIKVKLTTPPLQSPTPAPANAEKEASRGKNKFFFSRWFGFGSK